MGLGRGFGGVKFFFYRGKGGEISRRQQSMQGGLYN